MVNFFRRFQQPLLIALTILIVISMVVLFNLPGSRGGGFSAPPIGTIYGRSITQLDFDKGGKRFDICRELGLFELLQPLVGNAQQHPEEAFTWNSIILRHEAEELGILSSQPSDAERKALSTEVENRVRQLPVFQNNGVFDPARFAQILQMTLSSRGFGERELEEVITDMIRIDKVKEVVGATVGVSPDEVLEAYTQENQKLQVSVVRLKLDDFKAAVTVTDDDVKKAFEERKETLKSAEKRKVKFAAFTLPKSDKPLIGHDRAEKMSELAQQAQSLAQAMTNKGADFDAEAQKAKATVGETPFFEAGQPPAELGASPQAAMAAFRLTKEQPNSDVVGTPQGVVVMQYAGAVESKPLTLEEAKAQLTEQLKQDRAQEAMNLKAGEIRTKIEADLKAGKSFAEAATAAGAKAEQLPLFSIADRLTKEADAMPIMSQAIELSDGQLSQFTPTSAGGLLVHLDQRMPIDQAAFDKAKGDLATELAQDKSRALFQDWLHNRKKEAHILLARG